ncbi:hypothetical protein GLOIN_2v1762616 [Rhizophagus clarus]|uniref:Uncharacterized protein n=1 Tax=Rhizophagus clarus TaxID=94130 RepID=A0A8H3L8K8_9GLOM|nr:hypothetical protein GLOIN_2v1762616 [Rhizophagus clarus]
MFSSSNINISAEFDDRAKDTMRKCFYNAGFDGQFTTEYDIKVKMWQATNFESLKSTDKCSSIFLGGFSESKYLQKRVKEEFGSLVPSIVAPKQ